MLAMSPSGIGSSIIVSGSIAAAAMVSVASTETVGKASSTSLSMKSGEIKYHATGKASRTNTPITIHVLRLISQPSSSSLPYTSVFGKNANQPNQ